MDWTTADDATLRQGWADGLTTAVLARKLGRTRNSIIGRSHRLALPSRPSPIRRMSDAAPRRAPMRRTPNLAAVRDLVDSNAPVERIAVALDLPVSTVARAVGGFRVLEQARPEPDTTFRPRAVSECCYPHGEPGTREFRYCDAPTLPGRVYCADHLAVAVVKVRDRREDAPQREYRPRVGGQLSGATRQNGALGTGWSRFGE